MLKKYHCCYKPDCGVHRPLESFLGEMKKNLKLYIKEALVCCKTALMGHSSGSVKDQNSGKSADRKNC